ncbi:FHA domain-containing protein [Rhizobium leguminosarum]|uniref:hypothetical protein n=1 Tax=Rhizobium leguminosarum TaxID=384 RepID=UPI001C963576|nr:hypothetical protein [Rhizobium leguminosarum]MBY5454343.1 FHA domain-containing protein [Rhizobium leguminosarum]
MKTFNRFRRNLANSVAEFLGHGASASAPLPPTNQGRRILVVGGGPVGLTVALTLHAMAPGDVDITVADGRWTLDGESIRWKTSDEGVNRRQQVVTVQSLVFERIPADVRSAIFNEGGYSQIWPTGRESPAHIGFPRNVRIVDVEDRLLEIARKKRLHLLPCRIDPAAISLGEWDLIVIADGANSQTREHFRAAFGSADGSQYSLNGRQVADSVLGLRVRTSISSSASVVLTIAQQRFLFNGLGNGHGLLYMRLTDDEAGEVRGRVPGEHEFRPCIQSNPCQVTWRADKSRDAYVCSKRGSVFVPAMDPASFLWPRVLDGLNLFQMQRDSLEAVTVFPLSMTRRGAFSAELTPVGTKRRVFGALLGDAAGVTHFWPGRGLNRGLSSAHALAVVVSRVDPGSTLRSADFSEFEGVMAQLQSRHQDRAWRAMVQLYEGEVVPTKAVISRTIAVPRPSRHSLIREMQVRIAGLSSGLKDRLPSPPDLAELYSALDRASNETLAVLVATGAWETLGSGGNEVDVNAILRLGASQTLA